MVTLKTFAAVAIFMYFTVVSGWQNCWLKSCDIISRLEVQSETIVVKQDELTNQMTSGLNMTFRRAFSGAESNITSTVIDTVANSELNVRNAVETTKEEVMTALNITSSGISKTVDLINAETSNLVTVSEGNIVNSLKSELGTSENNVIASVLSKIENTERTINEATSHQVNISEEYIVGTLKSELGTSESKVIAALASEVELTQHAINTATSNQVNTSEYNIVSTLKSDLAASESNVLTTLLAGIDAAQTRINAATTNKVNISEENIVNTFRSELVLSVGQVIGAVLAEINITQRTLNARMDEIVTALAGSPAPFSPGFNVGATVTELKIELDIFSGVVNPSWILTNESANFNGLIGILAGTPSTPLPSRLGYRGFNVRFLLNDGTYVYQTFGYGGQAASTIETVLLNSHDGVLSSEVLSIAAAAIHDLKDVVYKTLPQGYFDSLSSSDSTTLSSNTFANIPDFGGEPLPLEPAFLVNFNPNCGKGLPCIEPDFNTSLWSSTSNNCYNYAVDIATGTYAQPGRAGGAQYTSLNESVVRGAAVLDGLKDHEDPEQGKFPETSNCLLALVAIPGIDYHFYRRDSDGTWSHKPGPRSPTQLDNAWQPITDPRNADMAPYKFIRFLSACRRKIEVE